MRDLLLWDLTRGQEPLGEAYDVTFGDLARTEVTKTVLGTVVAMSQRELKSLMADAKISSKSYPTRGKKCAE